MVVIVWWPQPTDPTTSNEAPHTRAAGGAERNWSTHDFLSGKRRQRAKVSTLDKQVYCYSNQRLLDKRLARGAFKKAKRAHYDEDGNEVAYPVFDEVDGFDSD